MQGSQRNGSWETSRAPRHMHQQKKTYHEVHLKETGQVDPSANLRSTKRWSWSTICSISRARPEVPTALQCSHAKSMRRGQQGHVVVSKAREFGQLRQTPARDPQVVAELYQPRILALGELSMRPTSHHFQSLQWSARSKRVTLNCRWRGMDTCEPSVMFARNFRRRSKSKYAVSRPCPSEVLAGRVMLLLHRKECHTPRPW